MRLAHQVTSVGPYRIEYRDCYCNHSAGNTSPEQTSDISLILHQVTSVGPYRIEYLDCYCITVLVAHYQHALQGSNFSHSKTRVSRDCQSSLVKLSYSYIKLQVWVLIECNTYDCCCNHSACNTSPACLKWSNTSNTANTARLELVETTARAV